MNPITMTPQIDPLLLQALREDISSEDVSTNAVIREKTPGQVDLLCKERGVIAGLAVFERVFQLLDPEVQVEWFHQDGEQVEAGTHLATLRGDIRALLSGERVALNYLQRMSGIATYTRACAEALRGSKTKLLDTRKTTPNMRIFEKYAVRVGGGQNHRYNLSDGVLLKDNHIGAAGGIAQAVRLARDYAPFVRKIEVEVENLEMVEEALAAMEEMREALRRIAGRTQTECSGNVTLEKLRALADLGVDYVSCGALTHSAPILDLSLKHLRPLEAK